MRVGHRLTAKVCYCDKPDCRADIVFLGAGGAIDDLPWGGDLEGGGQNVLGATAKATESPVVVIGFWR